MMAFAGQQLAADRAVPVLDDARLNLFSSTTTSCRCFKICLPSANVRPVVSSRNVLSRSKLSYRMHPLAAVLVDRDKLKPEPHCAAPFRFNSDNSQFNF